MKIGDRTLDEWKELAKQDNDFVFMVPSDLRQMLAAIPRSQGVS
jgi:hypothetical protein